MIEMSKIDCIDAAVSSLEERVRRLEGEPIVSKNGAAACEAGGKYEFTDIADAMRHCNKVTSASQDEPAISPDPWWGCVPVITKTGKDCWTAELSTLDWAQRATIHLGFSPAMNRTGAILEWNRGVTKYKALADHREKVADDLRKVMKEGDKALHDVRLLQEENTMFRNQSDRKGDMVGKLQSKLDDMTRSRDEQAQLALDWNYKCDLRDCEITNLAEMLRLKEGNTWLTLKSYEQIPTNSTWVLEDSNGGFGLVLHVSDGWEREMLIKAKRAMRLA